MKVFDRFIGEIYNQSQQRNIHMVLTFLPSVYQVHTNLEEQSPQEDWEEIAQNYGLDFIDFLPIMRANRHEDLYFDQCHPTPKGNAIMGEYLVQKMQRKLWKD